jgi:hypothetical protein
MNRVMGMIGALLLAIGFGSCGGSSGSDCNAACTKIYTTCMLSLADLQGNPLPFGQCVSTCNAVPGAAKQTAINCVMGAACNLQAINACIGSTS